MKNGKTKAKTLGVLGIIVFIFVFIMPTIIVPVFLNSTEVDFETEMFIMNITFPIMLIGLFFSIALFVIAGIVYSIHRTDVDKPKNIAKKLLYERYAKGEINKEEFEQMKKDIED